MNIKQQPQTVGMVAPNFAPQQQQQQPNPGNPSMIPSAIHQQQQQQQPMTGPAAQLSQQQQQQHALDLEQKKLHDMLETLLLIGNIRDDINVILDNVAKSNSANNTNAQLIGNKTSQPSENDASTAATATSTTTTLTTSLGSVSTPASVTNANTDSETAHKQQQLFSINNPSIGLASDQLLRGFTDFGGIDVQKDEQQLFFEKTNIKFLQDKIQEVNKNFM